MSTRTNSIVEAWVATLARRQDAPAILGTNGAILRTFLQIEADAQRFLDTWSAHFSRPPGTVIAVQIGNSPLLPGLLLTLWRLGLVPVLLDRSLEGAARENALATCRASCCLTWPTPETNALSPESALTFAERPGGEPQLPDTQFLKLTSGTTGASRAIRFTAAQLQADAEAVCDTMGITEEDLNYGLIPWSHSYGFSNLVTPLLVRGVPVVATEERLPRALLAGLAATGATVFPGLPIFFQKLADLATVPLPRLRLCISAGAPLLATTATAFRDRLGIKLHSFYGSSECGGIAYDASDAEVPEGCVGQPMRGVDIIWENPGTESQEAGRITVHGAAVGLGYYPEEEATILHAGKFTPGDLARRTPQGLVLTGRVSDFINIAGRKLNPVGVETVLHGCPGVTNAVVFGAPHPHRGEEPVALIVGAVELGALQAHCAQELPAWQIPRDFWIVDTLPVSERGKLNRRSLAEAYRQRTAAHRA